jgi:glycosyltransferase involved in cell wall biosynthesis
MRISVVTVCLNAGLDIGTAASIVAQEHPDNGWIIDGGSQDGMLERLCAGRRSPDMPFNESDDGIADACNMGLARATGDAVWFMNAGDEFASSDSISGRIRDWDRERYHTSQLI